LFEGSNKGHSLNVLGLVFVGDGDIATTGYQINRGTLAELLIVNRECKFDNSIDVIIPVAMLVEHSKANCADELTESMPGCGANPHLHPPYLEE
jgi:hypothetical protein